MSVEKITIKELSSQAEIINIFNCPAGKISIFNGPQIAISSLQRLLTGTYEKNDLKISINNSIEFNPFEHTLIGYNNIIKDTTMSVENLFLSYKIDKNDIDIILNTYGLYNIKNLKIYELDADKKKRIEFAIAFQSQNKALIIRSPFVDMSTQWKEPYAKFIYTYATKKNLPVIITDLDYTPATWNKFPSINKIQLGISINKTIGFGTDNKELNELLSDIRNHIDKTKDATSSPTANNEQNSFQSEQPEILVNNTEKEKFFDDFNKNLTKKDLKNIHLKLFFLCFILIGLSGFLIYHVIKSKNNKLSKKETVNIASLQTQSIIDALEKPYILNEYPVEIKDLVEVQITSKEILNSKEIFPLVKNNLLKQQKKEKQNLFMLLESISGSGKNLPDQIRKEGDYPSQPRYDENTNFSNQNFQAQTNQQGFQNQIPISEAEAKRQLIYQRFQEAMKRKKK